MVDWVRRKKVILPFSMICIAWACLIPSCLYEFENDYAFGFSHSWKTLRRGIHLPVLNVKISMHSSFHQPLLPARVNLVHHRLVHPQQHEVFESFWSQVQSGMCVDSVWSGNKKIAKHRIRNIYIITTCNAQHSISITHSYTTTHMTL